MLTRPLEQQTGAGWLGTRIVVAFSASCLALAGCSDSVSLSSDSTCGEYFELSSETRRDQLNQLGAASGWAGTGNPLYLTDFEARCGSSPSRKVGSVMDVTSTSAESQTEQNSPPVETPPTTSGLSMDDFVPARTWSWNAESTDFNGVVTQSQFGQFEVGEIVSAAEAPYFEDEGTGWSAGEGCDVQAGRDAVIPFRITITNAHVESVDPSTVLADVSLLATEPPLSIEMRLTREILGSNPQEFGEFLTCGKHGFEIKPLEALASQQSHTTLGFFVMRWYYETDTEDVDPRVFDELGVQVDAYERLVPPGATGPGVVASPQNGGRNSAAFYVSGVLPDGIP